MDNVSSFEQLPPENLLKIFSYLGAKDIVVAKKACRRFREVALKNSRILNRDPCWLYIIPDKGFNRDVLSAVCVYYSKGRRFQLVAHFQREMKLLDVTNPLKHVQVSYIDSTYTLPIFLNYIISRRKIESHSTRDFSQSEKENLTKFFTETRETFGAVAIKQDSYDHKHHWEEFYTFTERSFPFNMMPLDIVVKAFPLDVAETDIYGVKEEKTYLGNARFALEKPEIKLATYGIKEDNGIIFFEFFVEDKNDKQYPTVFVTTNEIYIEHPVGPYDNVNFHQEYDELYRISLNSTLEENYLLVMNFYLGRYKISELSLGDGPIRNFGVNELSLLLSSVRKHNIKVEELYWYGDSIVQELVDLENTIEPRKFNWEGDVMENEGDVLVTKMQSPTMELSGLKTQISFDSLLQLIKQWKEGSREIRRIALTLNENIPNQEAFYARLQEVGPFHANKMHEVFTTRAIDGKRLMSRFSHDQVDLFAN